MLSGTTDAIAAIIFFRIGDAVRGPIIEKLFQQRFGDKYSLFRNSLTKELRDGLGRERNEIVHWNMVNSIFGDGDGGVRVNLGTAAARIYVPAQR